MMLVKNRSNIVGEEQGSQKVTLKYGSRFVYGGVGSVRELSRLLNKSC